MQLFRGRSMKGAIETAVETIRADIVERVRAADATGVVLGISGGVDSAVYAHVRPVCELGHLMPDVPAMQRRHRQWRVATLSAFGTLSIPQSEGSSGISEISNRHVCRQNQHWSMTYFTALKSGPPSWHLEQTNASSIHERGTASDSVWDVKPDPSLQGLEVQDI
jgi:hypothetical protein